MKRLTEQYNGEWVTEYAEETNYFLIKGKAIDRLAAYEDTGLTPEEVQKLKKSDASKEQCTIDQHGEIHRLRDELKRYKQAEQEGRLYNLPLKPGDTIYRPEALQFCWVITKVEIYDDEIVFIDDSDNIFRPDDIGKTVFLTKEEAEKALESKVNMLCSHPSC